MEYLDYKIQGECCFLGGKRDPTDRDDVATAMREAYEELGIESSRLTVLCQMSPMMGLTDQSSSLVTPVIAHFDDGGGGQFAAKCNPDEVEMAFEVETERFLRADEPAYTRRSVHSHGREHYFHYFKLDVHTLPPQRVRRDVSVWGMTSYLAILVASMLHSRLPAFELDPEKKLDGRNYNEFNEWYILDKTDAFLSELITKTNKAKTK